MSLSIVVAISLVFAAICFVMAKKKNRSPVLWAILGFLFGPIPVVILALMNRAG